MVGAMKIHEDWYDDQPDKLVISFTNRDELDTMIKWMEENFGKFPIDCDEKTWEWSQVGSGDTIIIVEFQMKNDIDVFAIKLKWT